MRSLGTRRRVSISGVGAALRNRSALFFLTAITVLILGNEGRAADSRREMLRGLASEDSDVVERTLAQLASQADAAVVPAIEALCDDRLQVGADGAIYFKAPRERSLRDPISGSVVDPQPSGAREVEVNNQVRRLALPVLAQLKLKAPLETARLAAAQELAERGSDEALTVLRSALQQERSPRVRDAIALAIARFDLQSDEPARQLAGLEVARSLGTPSLRGELGRLVAPTIANAEIRKKASRVLDAIDSRQRRIDVIAALFHGLSLGSILLLAALGLAVTFGLLGVINMAHGEMLMIGAYTTYAVQIAFERWLPGGIRFYLLAAVPLSFLTTLFAGVILERTVIRFLYGRPLETLLATWGISLVLIQSVRLLFGAQNVAVANPSWLSGGVEIAHGLVLPYSRIAVILFAIVVTIGVWALLQRTRLGLQVRAVTQNRSMSACLGISTSRIDMWMFGLGSGIAGLGGVALSQIGNVGPELGQTYIIDSFMVVVVGGVGRLAGSIVASLGLGVLNEILEPFAGAVLGKIAVLVLIILFIQRRPQGLFTLKGRIEA
ncbi:MAG TPA: urea ABC transporter permease subunit UrtB [Polyangia bacterium]